MTDRLQETSQYLRLLLLFGGERGVEAVRNAAQDHVQIEGFPQGKDEARALRRCQIDLAGREQAHRDGIALLAEVEGAV